MKLASLLILPAAMLALTACSNVGGSSQTTMINAPKGAAIVNTYTNSATVTAVNPATRQVSLTFANGARRTVKCRPEVVNFNQIHVHDRVNLTYTEELAVALTKGKAPGASTDATVALAPVGAKPGATVAGTVKASARILAVNPATRMVKLKLADGTTKSLKVGDAVNLNQVKVGESVTVSYTESVAITVSKP